MEHFNETPEPTEAQILRQRIAYLESDLQRTMTENRQLRKRLNRAEVVFGIQEAA